MFMFIPGVDQSNELLGIVELTPVAGYDDVETPLSRSQVDQPVGSAALRQTSVKRVH